MAIVKPASLPRYGEVVGAQGTIGPNETEPNAGKKDIGWIAEEEPPHSYFNWLHRLTYDWLQYVNDLTNQALTWVGQQQFSGNKLQHVGDPAAADDAATKNYIDATFVAAAHAWGADQSLGGHKITNLSDPGAAQDAATKAYVDIRSSSAAARRSTGDDGNINCPTGADTKITFPAGKWKVLGAALTSDNAGRITVQVTGTYRIFATVEVNGNSGSSAMSMSVKVFKNGVRLDDVGYSEQAQSSGGSGCVIQVSGEFLIDLLQNDYIELFVNAAQTGTSPACQFAQLYVERKA